VTTKIYAAFKAYDDTARSSNVYVDCKYRTSDPSLVLRYQFGGSSGPAIDVAASDVILDDVRKHVAARALTLPKNLGIPTDSVCSLGIQSSSDVYLLGDTFLRSAYAVYDLTHDTIALAQSFHNATKSNIIELTASATGIPRVTGATKSQGAVTNSTNGGSGSTGGGGSNTGTGSGSSSGGGAGSSQSSNAAIAGRGVPGASYEVVMLAGIVGVFTVLGSALFAL
jgi:uncharacterized membrane protein YgcG